MNAQTTLPVTQAELTNTDIDHSIKIGKQVLISKLNEESDKIVKTIKEGCTKIRDKFDDGSSLFSLMLPRFELTINSCSQLSKLRLAINTFEEKPMRNNMKMVTDYRLMRKCSDAVKPFWIGHRFGADKTTFNECSSFRSIVDSGQMEVEYSIGVAWRDSGQWHEDGDECCESRSGFTETIDVPEDTLELMRSVIPDIENLTAQQAGLDAIKKKLNNIDKTMEEMEAQLLIKELGRTNRGKEVLSVASDLIKGVLGDSFVSLESPTKSD